MAAPCALPPFIRGTKTFNFGCQLALPGPPRAKKFARRPVAIHLRNRSVKFLIFQRKLTVPKQPSAPRKGPPSRPRYRVCGHETARSFLEPGNKVPGRASVESYRPELGSLIADADAMATGLSLEAAATECGVGSRTVFTGRMSIEEHPRAMERVNDAEKIVLGHSVRWLERLSGHREKRNSCSRPDGPRDDEAIN
jgi:hypothetical protein